RDERPSDTCSCEVESARATNSVCSPPQPNPGLPGFGHFKICRKRASPPPAGEGLGVGVHRRITAPPPPPRHSALKQRVNALKAPTLPTRGRVGPSTRHFTPDATTDRARPS